VTLHLLTSEAYARMTSARISLSHLPNSRLGEQELQEIIEAL